MNPVLKRSHDFSGLVTRLAMALVTASLKSGLASQKPHQSMCLAVLFLGREALLSAPYGTPGPYSRRVVPSWLRWKQKASENISYQVIEGRQEEHQCPGFRHLTARPRLLLKWLQRERLINRVSQSISINWGESPVAALCVRGCVWGKPTPGTYKTGSCWADSPVLPVTHGTVSAEPWAAQL